MKRESNAYMEIELLNVTLAELSQVDVMYRQYKNGGARKAAVWKADGSGDCISSGADRLLVPWTREETRLFYPSQSFWLDVRPVTAGGLDLETELVELRMAPSLFGQDGEDA